MDRFLTLARWGLVGLEENGSGNLKNIKNLFGFDGVNRVILLNRENQPAFELWAVLDGLFYWWNTDESLPPS